MTTTPPKRSFRWLLTWSVLFCVPTWLSWLGTLDLHWFLELFTHFRLQYAIGLLLPLLPLLWLRKWPWAGMVGVTLLTNAIAVIPFYFGGPDETKGSHKLLLANVLSSNRQHHRLKALIQRENPDVIVLLEVSKHWSESLSTVRKRFRYGATLPQSDNFGIAVLSRRKMRHIKHRRFGPFHEPSLSAQVKLGKQWVWLLGTHPVPPVSTRYADARDAHIDKAAALMARLKGPKILAGDLNVTSWSPAFRHLQRRSQLRDSRIGFGLQPTWLRHTLLFALPIDHILVSREIAIYKRWVGPDIGSDHRPVLFQFSLR